MRIRAAIADAQTTPFVIEELELDDPQDDEVLVRVVATGICQTDAHVWHQRIPAPLPMVLGHEGAGVVERVGEGITDLEPGDHVVLSFQACGECPQCLSGNPAYCERTAAVNFGGTRRDGTRALHRAAGDVNGHFFGQSSFATHALTTRRNTVKVSKDVPLETLAPLGCGVQTGAGAVLNSFALAEGDTIAVFGVGAVGFSAVMAARAAGAATIIAVDVNEQRLALAEELGATHAVNARNAEDVTDAIKVIASAGVDFVLDTTGRPDMLAHAVSSLASMGQVGLVAGAAPEAVIRATDLAMGKSVRGIIQGDATPQLFIPRLVQMYIDGLLPIDRLLKFYDFEDINTAFSDAAGGDVVKPVLRFDGNRT
ncbi:NAD(P)-dependent alcohol dehydrogenase [Streptomyces rubiginosohelvolus]|uniref:NAD(P)-dependent alcohol dehydrogenase n=1 Tax=Streptomyces rubiginosohelvolus TaxID=67362 RepID=UPI00372337B8